MLVSPPIDGSQTSLTDQIELNGNMPRSIEADNPTMKLMSRLHSLRVSGMSGFAGGPSTYFRFLAKFILVPILTNFTSSTEIKLRSRNTANIPFD